MLRSKIAFSAVLQLVVLLVGGSLPRDVDFCAKTLCHGKHRHIACRNNGEFATNCPSNARMIGLEQLHNFILAQHNFRRNLVASGKFSHFQSAHRMATMAWSTELAALAALNVRRCRMQHDRCHNTPAFRRSGQNLGFSRLTTATGERHVHAVHRTVRDLIAGFFAEHKHIKMAGIRKFPKGLPKNGKIYDHFTVMVNDHNTHVGCAAAEYQRNASTTFLFACNYARMNIVGRPVYAVGRPAAQGCRTGRNRKYRYLCSRFEKFHSEIN